MDKTRIPVIVGTGQVTDTTASNPLPPVTTGSAPLQNPAPPVATAPRPAPPTTTGSGSSQ